MSAHATVPADLVSGAHPDTQEGREVFRKVIWRIVPFLTVALIFNNMDRTNVGFAALTINRDLGLTASQFGLGAGILFASLCALEIPSNLALHRFGAPRWIARVMISWGILAAATAFVVGPYSFYIVRFLLGAAEAGFFPGVIYIFATWFPANYRTRIYAWFLLSSPLAATISGPLSAAILPMDGFLGLAGWSWMLLLQGLPVVFLGLMCPWILANKPEDAVWLTPEERATAVRVLAAEKRNDPSGEHVGRDDRQTRADAVRRDLWLPSWLLRSRRVAAPDPERARSDKHADRAFVFGAVPGRLCSLDRLGAID